MNPTDPSEPPAAGPTVESGPAPRWRTCLVLALWCLVPALIVAASRGLWAPDEPRYAEIARQVRLSGDWLVLHLAGEVYPDKPPLMFWLLALLGAGAEGVPDTLLRLPSLLATAGTAWLTARIARAHGAAPLARVAPWVLLTMALPMLHAGRVQLDPLLAFWTTLAIHLATSSPAPSPARRLGAGLAAGLGGLTKGPVAWLVVGLALLAMRGLPRRSDTSTHRRPFTNLAAVLLAVLPVAAWAAAAIAREPSLREHLLWGQHANRIWEARSHPGPFWEPLVEFLLLTLPWTPLLLVGGRHALRAERSSIERRALRWLLALLIVFSLIAEKRNLYLLPAYPAAALLVAAAVSRAPRGARTAGRLLCLTPAAVALAALAAIPFADTLHTEMQGATAIVPRLVVVAAAAAATTLWVARRATLQQRAQRLAVGHAATVALAAALFLPLLDARKSAETLARRVAAQPESPRVIPCLGVRPTGYRYYGGLPAVEDPNGAHLAAQVRDGDSEILALVNTDRLLHLDPHTLRGLSLRDARAVGSRHVLLLVRR